MTMTLFGMKARGPLRAALVLAFFYNAAPAFAQPLAASSAPPKSSVKLTTVMLSLPTGTPYLRVTEAVYCIKPILVRTASGNQEKEELSPYTTAFKSELEPAGYQVVSADQNLFGQEDGASDYQVAAIVTDMHVQACVYMQNFLSFTVGDTRGDGSMTIDWQVYSPLRKQVVARVTTTGTATLEKSVPGGYQRLVTEAFASNARALAANPEFRTAMNAARPARDELLTPTKNDPIALSGSLTAPKRSISDSVGSVVTLLTGSGSGSGALVSDDGYIITDAHVVGDEKHIRARWPDGIETVADVIRVAKDRDVALVKTNPRDRSPLPIRRGAVTPGQRVFAIGSPNGQKFQGTVSSGVVSATRTFNGLRYIQSDVSVSFGSSGGPLLDADGAVIGFTDLGIPNEGQPAGLNLFTPIGDAMDFLNLGQK
jgi:serine protease Do